MGVFKAFAKGINSSIRVKKIILFVFIVNLIFGLVLALPLYNTLQNSFGNSLVRNNMMKGFDYQWWSEFQFNNKGFVTSFNPSIIGIGAILNNKPAVDTGRINREYSRVWRKTQRRYQKMFYLCKEMFLDCSDKDINLLLQKVEKFYTKADRSTPFTFPLITFLRIAILFLPKMIKHLRVLFR